MFIVRTIHNADELGPIHGPMTREAAIRKTVELTGREPHDAERLVRALGAAGEHVRVNPPAELLGRAMEPVRVDWLGPDTLRARVETAAAKFREDHGDGDGDW